MSDLDRLFYWRGIAPDYYNYKGEYTVVPQEQRVNILRTMGVDTSTTESIAEEAYDLDIKPWLSWLPPLSIVTESLSLDINICPSDLDEAFSWSLFREGILISEGAFVPSSLNEVGDYLHGKSRFSRRRLVLENLGIGYYQIALKRGDEKKSFTIASVPKTAFLPSVLNADDTNPWGFVVQLYTLRSESNWGIGDFSDLACLLTHVVGYGVDIIGLNPFHVLQTDLERNFSPYAPSDRRYISPLYIDVSKAPGYASRFKPEKCVEDARRTLHVDYSLVYNIKYPALFACFESFLVAGRETLKVYVQKSPASLVAFANFEAQHRWKPTEYKTAMVSRDDLISVLGQGVELSGAQKLVLFQCYLQWVAETQLQECHAIAKSHKMKIGLLRDLAVGASGSGAEAETNQRLFCREAAIGAPPDPFSHIGQNWGIPPMDPAELRRTGFEHYISLLRSNMASCGALRIDHAMSLYRLWWCPAGERADQGAYIYYPFEEMLGLLCLESHLNKCVIVAEDLGVVPDEFRSAMSKHTLFANRLFYFEKWHDAEFKHPSQYDRQALAMLDNHDVPTLSSWWNGSDLQLRQDLDLFEHDEAFEHEKSIRIQEKQNLIHQVSECGFLPEKWINRPLTDRIDFDLLKAIVKFVATAHSQFYVLQLEDLLMMEAPVNLPGTYMEHPNWSRKLDRNIDEIFSNENIRALLTDIASVRQSVRGSH